MKHLAATYKSMMSNEATIRASVRGTWEEAFIFVSSICAISTVFGTIAITVIR